MLGIWKPSVGDGERSGTGGAGGADGGGRRERRGRFGEFEDKRRT